MTISLALLDGSGPLTADDLARAGADTSTDPVAVVNEVLDEVATVLRDDPGFAGRVLERLQASTSALGAPAAAPAIAYLLVQVRVGEGRLTDALAFTEIARSGYLANGDEVQALRTNLGRANVLNEMGRYDEALVANATVLEALPGLLESGADPLLVAQLSARAHAGRADRYEHVGRYADALVEYEAADAAMRRCGDDEGVADLAHNRVDVLMAMGRIADATAALQRAAELYGQERSRLRLAAARVALARGHVEMGEYADALDVLASAASMVEAIDARQMRYELGSARGDAYMALNLLHEAIDEFREIGKLSEETEFALERSRASYSLGRSLARIGDAEASEVLDAAVAGFRDLGQDVWTARALVAAGLLALESGIPRRSANLLREAVDVADRCGARLESLRGRLALQALGALDAAASADLYHDVEALAVPPLLRHAAHLAGRQALSDGDFAAARAFFATATQIDERQRLALAHESLLVGLGSDTGGLTADRVRLELAGGASGVPVALLVADRGKSRSLVELAAGVCRRGARVDDEARAIEGDLHAAYRQMFDAAADVAGFGAAQRRAAELEGRLSRRKLASVAAARADYFIDVELDAPSAGDPDLAEIAYTCLGSTIIAFVRQGEHVDLIDLPIDVPGVQSLLARLDAQHGRIRLGDGFAARNEARLEQSCRAVLGALYDALFAPLARSIARTSEVAPLLIAPDGPLNAVPFHALWDGAAYLVDSWVISVAPSLALFARCSAARAGPVGAALVVGVADELAPLAIEEARAIAAMTNAELLVGADATAAAVSAAAGGCSLVHIASHAWYRADNPMFSAVRLSDRWLTAAEVLDEFQLGGATVVLSACDTGRGASAGGSEVLGLARGFLGAGASSLVVSLWPTHDAATETLMRAFHEALPEHGPAGALRIAQLTCKSIHRHPTMWAPFTVVGAR